MSVSNGIVRQKDSRADALAIVKPEEPSVDSADKSLCTTNFCCSPFAKLRVHAMAICSHRETHDLYQCERRRHVLCGTTRWECASHFLLNTVYMGGTGHWSETHGMRDSWLIQYVTV